LRSVLSKKGILMKDKTIKNIDGNVKTTTRETVIGKQKYKVVSYYIGDKDINKVIEELAVRKALYEYNYEGGYGKNAG
jgi:hypothetical protein